MTTATGWYNHPVTAARTELDVRNLLLRVADPTPGPYPAGSLALMLGAVQALADALPFQPDRGAGDGPEPWGRITEGAASATFDIYLDRLGSAVATGGGPFVARYAVDLQNYEAFTNLLLILSTYRRSIGGGSILFLERLFASDPASGWSELLRVADGAVTVAPSRPTVTVERVLLGSAVVDFLVHEGLTFGAAMGGGGGALYAIYKVLRNGPGELSEWWSLPASARADKAEHELRVAQAQVELAKLRKELPAAGAQLVDRDTGEVVPDPQID